MKGKVARIDQGSRHTWEFLRMIGVPDTPPRTSPFDPGYDPATLISHLEQSGHLISSLKISMACWLVANEKFPSGVDGVAAAISEAGFAPGIWLAPFLVSPSSELALAHPEWLGRDADDPTQPLVGMFNDIWGGFVHGLDVTRPDVQDHLASVAAQLVEAGYRYLKLDFTFSAKVRGRFEDPTRTPAERVRAGYEAVLTQRIAADLPRFKRWTSTGFYRVLSAIGETEITAGGADYRLLSRPVLGALREMREYHRFLRGMVAWTGYRTVVLPYAERPRIGGRTKYSWRGMTRLAADATFSFSLVPLKIALAVGLGFLTLAAAEACYVLSFWLTGRQHQLVPGWASLMFMILIVGAALMIAIGLVGIYVGYIFQEVKRRPVYLVRAVHDSRGDRRPDAGGGTAP